MKDQERKTLTGFLGECWHIRGEYYDICHKCKKELPDGDYGDINRTFDTWEDFGALMEKIEKKDLFLSWLHQDYYELYSIDAWRQWEKAIPEKRCLIILEAIEGLILKGGEL